MVPKMIRTFSYFSGVLAVMLAGCGGEEADNAGALNPALGDRPVVYVKRTLPRDPDSGEPLPDSLEEPTAFHGGAALMLRSSASPGAAERNLMADLFQRPVDIKDPSVSPDGRRLVFALRAPEDPDADDDEQPTWNIWEYRFTTDSLRRVIASDLIAEEGQDLAPRYLPDGRIVFSSTRQRQARARLLDEGRPSFEPLEESRDSGALALHVMDADGSNIRQISFNMSHDLAPVVARDGQVYYSRWDNNAGRDSFNIYRTRPDGVDEEIVYGADSHEWGDQTVQYQLLAELSDGRLLAWLREPESLFWSGTPVAINGRDFINRSTPVDGVVTGASAEQQLAGFGLEQTRDDELARTGRVGAVAPLADGSRRLLVAWSPCRVRAGGELQPCTSDNAGATEEPPAHGLWVFDLDRGTRLPVVTPQPGRLITDAVVVAPRPDAALLTDLQPGAGLDQTLHDEGAAIIDIRSVYDRDGAFEPGVSLPGVNTLEDFRDPGAVTAEQRPVAFVRLTRGVLIPGEDLLDLDDSAFGRVPALGMREILGYVPVEPDGSARFKVPANVPLSLQLVDRNGRALSPRHRSWLSLRPGQEMECTGCHERGSAAPHGRPDAQPASINPGAPVTGDPFPNTRPALFADAGEAMAQVRTRHEPDALNPSLEMTFTDIWTDPNVRTPDPDWSLRYDDLDTPVPATPACRLAWDPYCSIVIHYPEHIQPIWEREREVMEDGMMVDVTCSDCHSRRDDASNLQVPPAQLELTGEPSPDEQAQATGYRELLFDDNALALEDGALVDAQRPAEDGQGNIIYQRDEDGNLILDEEDNPVPVMETIPVSPPMVAGSARASRFFSMFENGGDHEGWLTAVEMRLLSEWLDQGGQNYNDPFAVPE